FEIRDSIAWLYGSGFPKSLDVSKAIDKAAGATPETRLAASQITAPATPDAERWQGWGTALKPAFEPVVVARKPLAGTVAANVLAHGTGALNIDGCRVGDQERVAMPRGLGTMRLDGCSSIEELRDLAARGAKTPSGRDARTTLARADASTAAVEPQTYTGRWPANAVLDESRAAEIDKQSGPINAPPAGSVPRTKPLKSSSMAGGFNHDPAGMSNGYGASGGASRFFYVAKAPKKERPTYEADDGRKVAHPTVKPLALI